MKRALVVGIDDYPDVPLSGCVNDAVAVAKILEKNGDGSLNFSVQLLTSDKGNVDCEILHENVKKLFQGSAETVLLYFAGHGLINELGSGYLVAQDGKKGALGISLQELLCSANQAHPEIKSSIIVLDSCNSGNLGEIPSIDNSGNVSAIGNGVTILAACHRSECAAEFNGHGLFTGIFLDSLNGSAADICGRITPASIYSDVDQLLGPWEQRPIYKANVRSFITLRQIAPKIPTEILRKLPIYFEHQKDVYKLDPSYEPDRENVPEQHKNIPIKKENAKIFKELQLCNRYGLIAPINAEHMYYAAINSTGCKLTVLGVHYRKLAIEKRI